MAGGKSFEDPHKTWIFLLPSVNEKFAIAELSSKRLCCHYETPSVRLFRIRSIRAMLSPPAMSAVRSVFTAGGMSSIKLHCSR